MPESSRIFLKKLSEKISESWRDHCARETPQPLSTICLEARHRVSKRRNERIPSVDRPVLAYSLRPVRIVKRQKGSLGKNIRRAETCRMLGIAFNFGWPAFVTLNQETKTVSGRSHTRGENNRLTRQQLFGRSNVRNNLLGRSGGASRERSKSERRGHDRKEFTPAQFIFWLLEHLPSPVADRAIGQFPGLVNVVFLHQLPAEFLLRNRRLPTQRENFFTRAEVILGSPMAIQTPFHVKGSVFPCQRHLIQTAVARLASNAFMYMNAVIEIDKVGGVVHPIPH